MDPKIRALQDQIRAVEQEFDLAVSFHETWRPTAYDADLRSRMGTSFSTHTYHLIRIALRREVYLALMRIWGKRSDELRVEHIVRQLQKPDVFTALVRYRMETWPFDEEGLRASLQPHVKNIAEIIGKYAKGGNSEATLTYLRGLRNEHLAHRAQTRAEPQEADHDDDRIETFYQDMSNLVSELFHLVLATAYTPKDTANVYRTYANLFWEAARGERTEGHPSYRPPLPS